MAEAQSDLAVHSDGDTLRVDLASVRGGRGRGRGDRQRNNRNGSSRAGMESGARGARRDHESVPSTAAIQHQLQNTTLSETDPARTESKPDEDESDEEVCFICASPVVHSSVAPCNHRTCHICSLRMRALYKSKLCPHCRSPADIVIFTDEAEKRFADFRPQDLSSKDDVLGIHYEKPEIYEDTVLLLRSNCPDSSCGVACLGWPDLHRHVKAVHHKTMCDLCTRNKKVFTHEHELFSKETLRKHEKFGDDNPGAVDQSGFTGHPECGFCRQRFYGDDELFKHCRERHERCHVCDSRNTTSRPRYYENYDALETHFRKDHFPCPDRECLEKKFVVFGSEMDLKAHQVEAHPNGLTRDARKVNISTFDYRTPHQEPARPRREPRGRGRDPNAEPLPMSSAQPLSRAELAFQRTLAVQSSQSTAPRTFGGQLTQTTAPSSHALSNARPSASASVMPASTEPVRSGPMNAHEQARQLRHNAVTERAANLVGNDAAKMTEFRDKVSAYRSGAIKARTLIESFFVLFDTSPKELGKLVQELADIFEVQIRKDELVKSWSDWRAINEDYPSLPGPSGDSMTDTGHGLSESRILKLKSSTAQSGRNAVSQRGRWAPVANGKTTPSVPFPSLSSATKTKTSTSSSVRPVTTAGWTTGGSSPAASSSSPAPVKQANPANLFPALPTAQKPSSTLFTPGFSGRGVIRSQTPASTDNYWSSKSASAETSDAHDTAPDGQSGPSQGQKKGKGKGKNKQVLYAWG